MSGPSCLCDKSAWPRGKLHCLSTETKQSIDVCTRHTGIVEQDVKETVKQSIVDPDKFSGLRKLYGVTAKVFQFINTLKHREANLRETVEMYWLRTTRKDYFSRELSFLERAQRGECAGVDAPKYVRGLNLFINKSGVPVW